jgi:hypothetical protein
VCRETVEVGPEPESAGVSLELDSLVIPPPVIETYIPPEVPADAAAIEMPPQTGEQSLPKLLPKCHARVPSNQLHAAEPVLVVLL